MLRLTIYSIYLHWSAMAILAANRLFGGWRGFGLRSTPRQSNKITARSLSLCCRGVLLPYSFEHDRLRSPFYSLVPPPASATTEKPPLMAPGRQNKSTEENEGLDRVETKKSTRSERQKAAFKRKIPIKHQIRAVLFGSWINLLLVAVPVGFVVNYLDINGVAIFVVNFIAIVPLAAMLSYATKEIALRVSKTLGRLLNATFRNVMELIIPI
ncbi:hypothetical protein V2W45_1513305 [Cenococcum geophilum]